MPSAILGSKEILHTAEPSRQQGPGEAEVFSIFAWTSFSRTFVYSKILAPIRGSRSLVRHESSTEAEFEG